MTSIKHKEYKFTLSEVDSLFLYNPHPKSVLNSQHDMEIWILYSIQGT